MTDLTNKWRDEANTLERNGYAEVARTLLRCASEAEAYRPADRTVSLTEASRLRGYSYQHLWRLVKSKRLTNYGQGREILVRMSELPKKAGSE